MPKHVFSIALLISFIIHLVLLIVFSFIRIKPASKVVKPIEVTYKKVIQKTKIRPPDESKSMKVVKSLDKEVEKPELLFKEQAQPTFFEKKLRDISKFSDHVNINEKIAPQVEFKDIHRTIKVPLLQSDKITNPKYLSYNQSVRQKIRERAYKHINHPDFQAGAVYLTFVIGSDGSLIDLKVIEEKTHANNYLKQVGLRSIEESSPFPPFPSDLSYPELTFNVLISFEYENE